MKHIKVINSDVVKYKKRNIDESRDYLTGLPNRKALYDYYKTIPSNENVTAMFIDVDFFKRVNDVYGHAVGDELLVAVANYLSSSLAGATIYRLGGDEFVAIMLGEQNDSETYSYVSAVSAGLQSIDFRRDVLSFISFSIGMITNQPASMMLDDILNRCDAALYRAKESGKNACVMYKTLEKEEQKKHVIEDGMNAAIAHNEFVPYLLPKVNMLTSKVVGAEVLCRWENRAHGFMTPLDFMTVFEKNGFIMTLDFYMYEEACKMKQSWVDTPLEELILSVNISTLNLYFKDLAEKLSGIADRYGVPHDQIQFEVSEGSFQKDSKTVCETVKKIVAAGFLVTIDNFGAGNSSLAILTDLPVQSVDLDRDFVRSTVSSEHGRQILKNIVNLCKDLKLDVFVEGVENRDVASFFMSCGCENALGYYFSPPIPEEEFLPFALSNYGTPTKPVHFTFNETLMSEDGKFEAEFLPAESRAAMSFYDGPFPGLGSVRLSGGPAEKNLLELPTEILRSESYTIALWAYTDEIHRWTSLTYVKFETGSSSIVPDAWEGYSSFRVRDSRTVNGWYDSSSHELADGRWYHIAVSYNAKTETAALYINGEIQNTLENVPPQRYCIRILVGGDVYQPSFKGKISELYFFNETKNATEIKGLYDSYFRIR